MNVKDSYIHGSDTLIKNLVFENHDNKRCLKITWAQEGKNDTWIEVGTVDGLSTSVTKNFVYAGPDGSSGHTANAAPTFRKLVAADIPNLSATYLPLAGGTMTGPIILTSGSTNAAFDKTALSFISKSGTEQARIGTDSNNCLGLYSKGTIYIRPNHPFTTHNTNGIIMSSTQFTYNTYKVWHEGNDGTSSGLDADLLDGFHSGRYLPYTIYNYDKGCLVKTDIPTSSNTMVTFRIEGNTYGYNSIFTTGEFYNYKESNSILQSKAQHHGYNFGNITVFCYNGYVYIWFKQTSNFQSFIVTVYGTNEGSNNINRVTSITNAALPTTGITRKVEITPKISLNSSNYTSYTVKKDGTGASGTWNINIKGNAATATNTTNVAIGTKNDNVNYYLPFVSNTSGNLPLYVDNTNTGTLTYNPSTGTLTTTKFKGALEGNANTATTATNATKIVVTADNTATEQYLVFVNGTSGNLAAHIDNAATGVLKYQPSTGTLSYQIASIGGNASVGGNLTVTGNTTISGNTTLGDAATDSVTINAYLNVASIAAATSAIARPIWFSYAADANGYTVGRPAYHASFTYNPNTGTVAATKFSGALSGNATTASNLNTAQRGYLYQTANTTTLGTGTVATTSGKIGVPIQFYGSQVNYTLNQNLFYATVTNNAITANTIYLDDNIKSKTFVKASNTAPSGVTSTTVQGSTSGGSTGVIYTAGNGINISGSTISTNTWTGTESNFKQLSNPSSYDVIYIIED